MGEILKQIFILLLILSTCISLNSNELIISVRGGKTHCSTDIESGNIFGLDVEIPLIRKVNFIMSIEKSNYDYTFYHWGKLQIIVPSTIVVSNYSLGLNYIQSIYSIKNIAFTFFEFHPGIHFIQTEVVPKGSPSLGYPENMPPYEHSPIIVPGISIAAGIKVIPFEFPLYLFLDFELSGFPTWNKYLMGQTQGNYITEQSVLCGLSLTIKN